ncbi:preprotein translocase subunit SecG [Gulosibacter macacae]|uniref:Protein-export membrane protein SecG n=1 Tax=Gulosibacter macacae TaxID=2488791 RepID=A0A3P3VXN5_9MICO|nr:preprotein translocase subunit SecG [Gulosibacter macacae]RRJ87234.1 preprotein translocase subunit SecG [Gulosibacter macacae]
MDILLVILQVLLAITSVLLVLFILLHRGKGGGVSDMFGGGVTSNIASSGVAEKNLNRLTTWTLVIWVAVIVLMGVITKFQGGLS